MRKKNWRKKHLKLKSFIEKNKINGKILGPVSAPIFRLKENIELGC